VHSDRLRLVSPLPPEGGWRADLAVDRSAAPPRVVLVARVPPSVAGDAMALARLARGLDLSSRVQHPGLRRLLGTGEVDGDLVLVEAWREGETLRALLDAGGPLAPALAARIAVDVAGALHAAHTLAVTPGRPFCHGAVSAERILLAADGDVLLCGMGRPSADDATPAGDVRGLARMLLEGLAPGGGDGSGPLAAVLDRALLDDGFPSAAAFAAAVGAAVTPAARAELAARVEAMQPEGAPAWLSRRRALEEALRDELAAPPASPPATPPPPLPLGAAAPRAAPEESATMPGPREIPIEEDLLEAADRQSEDDLVFDAQGRPLTRGARDFVAAHLAPEPAPVAAPTPVAVALAMGLLGLLLGFWLGGR
jgi:hypothetical protein